MVLTRRQAEILINQFKNLSINQQVKMAAPVVNYVLRPFEGKTITEYPQGDQTLSLSKNQIDKEDDKLDISVSNAKDVLYNFISLAKIYEWVHL